jgi:HD-GYP domain-containing protein (c-di-GMP phosphodiesterase class II)
MLMLTAGTGRGAGIGRPWLIAKAVVGDLRYGRQNLESVCEAASLLAGRIGLGRSVQDCLAQQFERWDGKGPYGLTAEEIGRPARVSEVANQAALFLAADGPDAALAMVQRRAGGWFDPEVVAAFVRYGRALMTELDGADPWQALLDAEPSPVRYVGEEDLDRLARSCADMVDVKSRFTLGHSSEVARLAEAAARILGLGERDIVDLRRAALLHDLGLVAISSGIWEKRGPLTRIEWEQLRLHPYHTERILACSSTLMPLARIAGLHHERLDGSGYHHGLTAAAIPATARVLAAADCFQTATQDRPHRPARTPEQAADHLTDEASAGRLDPECVQAVIQAAGQPRPRVARDWPAGLSDREIEVVRLMCRGLSNAQIARRLSISSRTAEHHVQHIYAKIGRSTRAAAALFAMEHDLLTR